MVGNLTETGIIVFGEGGTDAGMQTVAERATLGEKKKNLEKEKTYKGAIAASIGRTKRAARICQGLWSTQRSEGKREW